MSKTKTEVALQRSSDSMFIVMIRNRDTRQLIKSVEFKKLDKAKLLFNELSQTEKYITLQLHYYDKDGAMRTLQELKL